MRHEHAAARVRRRIAEWVKAEGHGSRKRLAEAVKGLYGDSRSPSWVTDVLDGPDDGGQDLRLRDLDAVAHAMKVPPGDLVRQDDNLYLEVTATEAKVLRYIRALPDMVRHHFTAHLEYLRDIQQRQLEDQARERDQRTAEAKRHHAEQRKQKHVS